MSLSQFDISGRKVMGELREPGYLCAFLASPAAAYITGQTWAVDSGVSIKSPWQTHSQRPRPPVSLTCGGKAP